MSFAALPVELLDAIFESVSSQTLATLAKTATAFTGSANRQLYRHLSLSYHAGNLGAISSLANDSELASFVRTFSITFEDSEDLFPEYAPVLSQALFKMHNLCQLDLDVGVSGSWVLQGGLPTYSLMTHFATSFPFDNNVASFITRTPLLSSLQLSSPLVIDSAVISPTSVPRLCTYAGPAHLLSQLTPSRPLNTLFLSGDTAASHLELLGEGSGGPTSSVERATHDRDDTCDQAYAKIEVLSVVTSSPPVLILEALAKTCPDLVCLRVMTTCAFWEAPDLTFYTKVANALSMLRSLSTFELSGMHWEARPKSNASDSTGSAFAEREWISPPVTPRIAEMNLEDEQYDLDINESFFEWSY